MSTSIFLYSLFVTLGQAKREPAHMRSVATPFAQHRIWLVEFGELHNRRHWDPGHWIP